MAVGKYTGMGTVTLGTENRCFGRSQGHGEYFTRARANRKH
jgi:hypothetical protein